MTRSTPRPNCCWAGFALALFLYGCTKQHAENHIATNADTAIVVYGPYIPVRLPITKGVRVSNPIQLALGPGGVLYAANQTGEIYSLRDTDNDGLEDTGLLYCDINEFGLRSPGGFAHKGDTIYIGTAEQIRAFLDLNTDGKADTSWVFFDKIPESKHPYEWTCAFSFGPDGWLYTALSTDSWNAAPSPDPNGFRGSIIRISPDGKTVERVITGIRSVYSMSRSVQGDLFFIDNEGGGNPVEELNLLVENGFYGHNPSKYTFDSVVGPVYALETEVAPSGILFNAEDNDFGNTAGDLFVTFYGPGERWNRGAIGRVDVQRRKDGTYSFEEFPVADIPKLSALAFGKDGALYVANHGKADYWYNAVYENEGAFYKLVFDPSLPASIEKPRATVSNSLVSTSVESGKQLYAELACLGCHPVDGGKELLGPNLRDIGNQLSREEILEEIEKPSERIKPSMMAVRVTKKDGQVMIGRIVNSNQEQISLMVVGNQVIQIPREDIESTEDDPKSLMYEGLLHDLTEAQTESLLDYIVSLAVE